MIDYKTIIKSSDFQKYIEKMREINHHYFPFNYINKYHLEGDIWSHTMMVVDYVQNSLKSFNNDLYLTSLFHDIGKTYNFQINKDKKKIQFINHWFYSGNIFRDYFLSKNLINRNSKKDKKYLFDLYKVIQLHQINQFPQEIKDNLNVDLSFEKFNLLKNLCEADGKGRILDDDIKEAGYDKYFEKYKNLNDKDFNNEYNHLTFSNDEEILQNLSEIFEKNNHKNIIIFPIAPPASGKSTISRKIAEFLNKEVYTVGYDQIRIEIYCEYKFKNKNKYSMETACSDIYQEAYEFINKNKIDIHSILMERINEKLRNKNEIIIFIDNTNASFKSRRKILKSIVSKEKILKIGLFFFNITLKEILERNKSRNIKIKESAVEHIYKTTAYPSLTEFDEILVI